MEGQLINGKRMCPGMVLQNGCQKRLSKIETTDPKHAWEPIFIPFLINYKKKIKLAPLNY